MQSTFASLVLYVRNEGSDVFGNLRVLADFMSRNFALYELVLVDDASDDDTLAQLRSLAGQGDYVITVVELARRHGVEAGMQAGLERAVGDWVFEIESSRFDFSTDLLAEMYHEASRGYEIVTAAGDSGSRRSRAFYWLVNRYAELDEPLRTVRVRLTSRRSLNAMLGMKEKVRYRKALYAVVGSRQRHLSYKANYTSTHARKLDRERTSLAFDILLSFSGFGLRLAHRLAFMFGLVSASALAYALIIYLFKEDVVPGWTTSTVLMAAGFSGVFLVLGVLGEYLARILVEVRARPLYSLRAADVVVPYGSSSEQAPPEFMASQRAAPGESARRRA